MGKKRREPVATLPELLPIDPAPAWQWWLGVVVAVAAAVIVYLPTYNNDLINWDDPDYLIKNDYIAESGGLARIWNPIGDHEQFYPLVFSSYWLEHKLVLWKNGETALESVKGVNPSDRGFEPWIFHLDNLILHAINAGLVVWLLRLLGLNPWVAWFAAALFAVHPINVASVAWIAERKNVLSGLFYLLSLIVYIKATRRWRWRTYSLCMLLYVMALMSKTAMLTLPATAILCDRVVQRRWSSMSLVKVAPMLILGMCSAVFTAWTERGNAGSTMTALEPQWRPFAAAGSIWFYIWKILVPYHFPGVYTRWDLRGLWPLFTGALLALPTLGYVGWLLRKRIPESVQWGVGHYLLSLSPMLGLIPFNYTQFSFVADHFVYIAAIGVFLIVAVLFNLVRQRTIGKLGLAGPMTLAACLILVGLGVSSYRHNRDNWKDGTTFWEYTLELNPACWPGQYNLANSYKRESHRLKKAGDEDGSTALIEKAALCYGKAAALKPMLHQAHRQHGLSLVALGRLDEGIEALQGAVATKSFQPQYRWELANALTRGQRRDEAADQYRAIIKINNSSRGFIRVLMSSHLRLAAYEMSQGNPCEAKRICEAALVLRPNSKDVRRRLGEAASSCARIGG